MRANLLILLVGLVVGVASIVAVAIGSSLPMFAAATILEVVRRWAEGIHS